MRKPKPKVMHCPKCGMLMIFKEQRFQKFICPNESCDLIEIRVKRHGNRIICAPRGME